MNSGRYPDPPRPRSGGFSAAEIDRFRRESPLSDAYESPYPGIRLFHGQRIRAILSLLSAAAGERSGPPAGPLLEIGCGDGFLLEKVAARFPGLPVRAVDISLTALRRAHRRSPAAKLVQSDASLLPLAGGKFDLALCSEVLEHVPDDSGLLREAYRILRPGGRFVLTTPNLLTFRNYLRTRIGREPKIEFREHLREYVYGDLVSLIAAAGFSIVRFRSVGFYVPKMHWFFRSRLLSGMIFTLARIFPVRGRDMMFLLRKPGGER